MRERDSGIRLRRRGVWITRRGGELAEGGGGVLVVEGLIESLRLEGGFVLRMRAAATLLGVASRGGVRERGDG